MSSAPASHRRQGLSCARPPIRAAALLLALAGSGTLAADDFSGRIFLGWQSFESGDYSSDGLVQRYDLRLDQSLGDPLRLSLTLRATDDSSGATQQGVERTSDYRELQPGVRLTYVLPTLQFQAQWNQLRSKSSGTLPGSDSDRTLDRFYSSLLFHPEDLPTLVADVRRTRLGDPETGADVRQDLGTLRLEYGWHGLRVGLTGVSNVEENRGLRFERTTDTLQANLGWSGALFDDRLSIAADALASRERVDRRALPGAGAVPNPVRPAETFEARDETPGDDRDHPLQANPRLRDGDLNRPAGVSLGPEAEANLNLAIDFGRFAKVDEVRVVARSPSGNPVTSGGAVSWDLWTSLDRVLWTPVGGATTRYDPLEGFWSVRFPQIETRYVKVVSFFVNSVPTEVTELLAFELLVTEPGRTRRLDLDLVTGTGNLTYRPVRNFSLSWSGVFNRLDQTPDRGPERQTRDSNQVFRAFWEIRPDTSFEVQRQSTRATQEGEADFDQQYDSWRTVLRWAPNLNLQTSLEAERSTSDSAGVRLTTDRYFLRGFARLWSAIDLNLDVGHQANRFDDQGWTISGPQVSGVAHLRLFRSLVLTTSASLQRNSLSGTPPVGLEIDENVSRYWAELFWRPSAQLGVGVRAGEARAGDRSTPLRGYRLDWHPFAQGSITLGATYDEDVDVAGDRRTRRLILTPAWQVNRRLVLQLSYLYLETTSPALDETAENLSAGLTWTF